MVNKSSEITVGGQAVSCYAMTTVIWEKVYFESQIGLLVHKYLTILDHFGIPVLFASGSHQHILKNVNITFSGGTATPEVATAKSSSAQDFAHVNQSIKKGRFQCKRFNHTSTCHTPPVSMLCGQVLIAYLV